jgi:hypothetical protein
MTIIFRRNFIKEHSTEVEFVEVPNQPEVKIEELVMSEQPTQKQSLKEMLLEAPDSQMDASVKPKINLWSDPPKAIEILEVLDDIVRYSLGSTFTVQLFQMMLNKATEEEKTTYEEVVKQAHWRSKAA